MASAAGHGSAAIVISCCWMDVVFFWLLLAPMARREQADCKPAAVRVGRRPCGTCNCRRVYAVRRNFAQLRADLGRHRSAASAHIMNRRLEHHGGGSSNSYLLSRICSSSALRKAELQPTVRAYVSVQHKQPKVVCVCVFLLNVPTAEKSTTQKQGTLSPLLAKGPRFVCAPALL